MRAPAGSPGSRAAWYALIGAAFLLVAAYAARQTLSLRERQQEEAVLRARGDLAAMLGVWERSVLERGASWISDLVLSSDPGRREALLLGGSPAVEAAYVWSTAGTPTLLHPPALAPDGERSTAAETLREPLAAAERALIGDRPQSAWELLSRAEPALYAPLADPRTDAEDLRALVRRRLLAAEALGTMGDRPRQTRLVQRTVAELIALPSPALAQVIHWLEHPLLLDLALLDEAASGPARRAAARARRRATGLDELSGRLARLTATAAEEAFEIAPSSEGSPLAERPLKAADLLIDASPAERGFVFLYALQAEGARGAALQLDAEALQAEALGNLPVENAQGEPVVLDAEGRVLRGDPRCAASTPGDGRAVWVQVPLGRLLPELRVGLCSHPDKPAPYASTSELLVQLAPVGGALALGALAILARARADRRQRELYDRQRAFITRVTHELKTPLAGIRIMAENLEIGAFRDAAQRELLAGRIVGEVDRLGLRIDEVLRVARADQPDRREPIALDRLASELALAWQERFATVGARLELDLKPCTPVSADAALLRDAVNNLLDNALKYLREDRPGLCRLSTREEGRWVVLEVADNGLGVPAGQRKAIFEAFTRVEGPGRGKAGGHGLGLSFVAETARAHGGTVECREGVEGGARFILRLRRTRW